MMFKGFMFNYKKLLDKLWQVSPMLGLAGGLLVGMYTIGALGLALGGLGGLLFGWTIRKCMRELNPQYD